MNLPLELMYEHDKQLTNDIKNGTFKNLDSPRNKYEKASAIFINSISDIKQLNYEFPNFKRKFDAPSVIIVGEYLILQNLK